MIFVYLYYKSMTLSFFLHNLSKLVLLASQINLVNNTYIMQHCPVEFYAMMEMFFQTSKSITAAPSHVWLWSTLNVATTEKLSCGFYLILINFHLQLPPVVSGFCNNSTALDDRKLCDARISSGKLSATPALLVQTYSPLYQEKNR